MPAMSADGPRSGRMTVAGLRVSSGLTEVMFLESARIYRLPPAGPLYEDQVRRLRASEASGLSVTVHFTEAHGDVIEGVE